MTGHHGADHAPETTWLKSSFSGPDGCVEVGVVGGDIYVRESEDPQRTLLRVSMHSWECFVAGVQNGDFDGLVDH